MSGGHTPGPWEANVNRNRALIQSASGLTIARISFGYVSEPAYDRHIIERRANARLIAASPDLLAALEAIVADCGYVGSDGYVENNLHHTEVDAARAAIARAIGGAA